MKNYGQYSIEDFMQDPYFRQWVLEKTPEASNFWEAYCTENPTQKADIDVAKAMVMGIKIKDIPVDGERMKRNIEHIITLTKQEAETPIVPLYNRGWFRVAAAIAFLVAAGLWWVNSPIKKQNSVANTEGGVKLEQEMVTTENVVTPLILPDGSRVTLEKNSRLTYDKDFKGSVRTVHLIGEAVFDVVKNPEKPFIVYAGNLVTKVLGTSFRIKALDKEANVTVNVIRGRVSVFPNKKEQQKDPETDNGLILTPNQKVTFTKVEERLKKTLVEAPIVVIPEEELKQMAFDEAPASTILKALEKAYSVEIMFDEDKLKKCELTTKLKNETLFDKLTIICKSIGATYKVVDAKVIIEGGDCD